MCVRRAHVHPSVAHITAPAKGEGRGGGHQRGGVRKQTVKKEKGGGRKRQVGGAGWVQWEESAHPWQLVDPIEADWLLNEAPEAGVLALGPICFLLFF